MAKDQNLPINLPRPIRNLLNAAHALIQRHRRLSANAARSRQPHMRDQHIRPGLGHLLRFLDVEHVRRRQQVHFVRGADHGHFGAVGHARLLEVFPEIAVDQADGGEVLDAGEAEGAEVGKEGGDVAEGVGAADAG